MNKEELLYDHYKDSFELLKNAKDDRNKLFIWLCVIIAIQFLLIIEPTSIVMIVTEWFKSAYNIDITIQFDIIQTFLWFILLYFTIRYYQINCYVERQYNYIHSIETRISRSFKMLFDRESHNYLSSYPLVLDGIHFLYTWVFPVLFNIIILSKIFTEIRNSSVNLNLIINCIICLCCFLLSIFYLIFLHLKDK